MNYCKLSAEDAVAKIKSGDRVFLHTAAATPQRLIEAMVQRSAELKNVEIVSLHTEGEAAYTRPEYRESFRLNALFVGKNKPVKERMGFFLYCKLICSVNAPKD